jgi:hypothetical protein
MDEIVRLRLAMDDIAEWIAFARVKYFATLYEGYNYGAL